MHTVFINGRFLTQPVTGVQRYAFEALLALDRRLTQAADGEGLRCIVLAPPGAPRPPLETIEFVSVGPLTGNAWEQITLAWATRGELLFSFSATGPLSKRWQMVTIHDASVYAVPQAFSRRFRSWYKFLLGRLARRVPRIITVSAFSQAELIRYLGCAPDQLRIATEGWQHIVRCAADHGILERRGLTSKGYVLAVSSHTPNKNFGLVVAAVQLLQRPGFDVVVAGGFDPRVFGGAHLPDLPCVRAVGYVSDAELRALYEHAAVFVYPSLYEGFGLPPIEAMALGCPVIAAKTASLPEVCGAAALYVSPHDPAALARAIQGLMADPEERERRASAGRRWIERYSWDECARLNLAFVRECLALPEASARRHTLPGWRHNRRPG